MAPSVKAAKVAEKSAASKLKITDAPKVQAKVAAEDAGESESGPIRGIPKSGRFWKEPQATRHSSMFARVKAHKKSWDEKAEERKRNKLLKQQVKDIKDETRKKRVDERKRQEERKRIKDENERKSQVVQTITDSRKLKRMSRKQLKQLVKV